MEEKVVVRKDLNEIVNLIGMKSPENDKFGRSACIVKLVNGQVLQFRDKDGFYDLLKSFELAGKKREDFIKSKELVEELKKNNEENLDDMAEEGKNTYICVKYTLIKDGVEKAYRLFPSRRVDYDIIDNCYDFYKKQKKETKKEVK